MKKKKQIFWGIDLLNGPFVKKVIGKCHSGCKKDFERYLGVSENNKDFADWFHEMVDEGVFIFYEIKKVGRGTPTKGYIINDNLLVKWIERKDLSMKNFIKVIITKKTLLGF